MSFQESSYKDYSAPRQNVNSMFEAAPFWILAVAVGVEKTAAGGGRRR